MNANNTRNIRTSSKRNRVHKRRKKQNKSNSMYVVMLIAITFIFSAFISTGATASKISDTECYRVSRGDTLWEIASECNTQDDDVRDIMDDIMKLNDMKSAELHVGDIIIIPVY